MVITNFTPVSAVVGGILIGYSAVIFLLINGRTLGISGILRGSTEPLANLLRGKTLRLDRTLWRLMLMAGLISGGLFVARYMSFNTVRDIKAAPYYLLAIAGFFVGIGTGSGHGCTSGHGICGLARRSKRSLVATITFMSTGMITIYILRHIYGLI